MAGHAGTFLLLHLLLRSSRVQECRVAGEERANKRNDIILQAKGRTGDGTKEEEQEDGRNRSWSGVRRLGDTYAIEIKPKQGWIQLASDVNDLFDLMPAIAETKPNKDTEAEDKRASEAKEQKDQEQQALTRDKCWCRYCNMQLLKVSWVRRYWNNEGRFSFSFHSFRQLHNGKIKRLGHYCPLELFSGYVIEPPRSGINEQWTGNRQSDGQRSNVLWHEHRVINFNLLHLRVLSCFIIPTLSVTVCHSFSFGAVFFLSFLGLGVSFALFYGRNWAARTTRSTSIAIQDRSTHSFICGPLFQVMRASVHKIQFACAFIPGCRLLLPLFPLQFLPTPFRFMLLSPVVRAGPSLYGLLKFVAICLVSFWVPASFIYIFHMRIHQF